MTESENNEAAQNATLDAYRDQVTYWKRRAQIMGSCVHAIHQMTQEAKILPAAPVQALIAGAIDEVDKA